MRDIRELTSAFLAITGVLALVYLGSARQSNTQVDIRLKLDTSPELQINYKHQTGQQ